MKYNVGKGRQSYSHDWFTFDVGSNGVEAGDLVGLSTVAPEDVVLWVNTYSTVTQILLSFSFKSAKRDRVQNKIFII